VGQHLGQRLAGLALQPPGFRLGDDLPLLGRPRLRFGVSAAAGTARTGFSRASMAVASRAM
jgi:hypothetical protein